MRKIISLFQRNHDGDRRVRDEVVPGAEWVEAGEGVATRKFDGTCCLVRDGVLWKRYDRKPGKNARKRHEGGQPWCPEDFRPAPPSWLAAETEPNLHTGHWPGWLPVGDAPEDAWHREAFERGEDSWGDALVDGHTYELCGPKINGNPEGFAQHELEQHGAESVGDVPRTFTELSYFLREQGDDIEGIVWHHADGRMVKIKARDFGIERVPREIPKGGAS